MENIEDEVKMKFLKSYFLMPILPFSLAGHCSRLPNISNQILTCSDDFQKCTYKCKSGYEMRNKLNDGVRMCQLNGTWSGANISCGTYSLCQIVLLLIVLQ